MTAPGHLRGSTDDNARLAEVAGAPSILCLNAGVAGAHGGPVWTTPPGEWEQVMSTNVGGVVNGLRAFVPRLVADGLEHHILITASLAGLATWPGGGAYAASEHAVVAVADQATLALAGTRVSVTVLCPALVRTAMSDEGADPADVAEQALAAVGTGTFAVLPPEWAGAVAGRAHRLTTGAQPRVPVPADAPAS